MSDVTELTGKKTELAAAEREIAAETERFEDSIAGLRNQCELLRIEYTEALRAELARIEHPDFDLGGVLAAIEAADQPIFIRRIRKLAVSYLAGRTA